MNLFLFFESVPFFLFIVEVSTKLFQAIYKTITLKVCVNNLNESEKMLLAGGTIDFPSPFFLSWYENTLHNILSKVKKPALHIIQTLLYVRLFDVTYGKINLLLI